MGIDTLEALDLLAHDLRNQVNALVAGSSLLETSTDTETAEIGVDMAAASRLLARWTDLLVECARSERGTQRAFEPIAMVALMELAGRRALRQRPGLHVELEAADVQVEAVVPGAERVLAGALVWAAAQHGVAHGTCTTTPTHAELRLETRSQREDNRAARAELLMLGGLGSTSGVNVSVDDAQMTLSLARA